MERKRNTVKFEDRQEMTEIMEILAEWLADHRRERPAGRVRLAEDLLSALEKIQEQKADAGMDNIQRKRILMRAVRTYGERAQEDMMIEEMAELTKAICKMRRAEGLRDDWADAACNVLEEMADVQIMLDQMKIIMGMDIEAVEEKKLERLLARLNAHDWTMDRDAEKEGEPHGRAQAGGA